MSDDNVDCKPTSSLPYPNGPLSDNSKAIELVNADVEKVSHLSKERYTRTCTRKLFYLLATNHTESHFNLDRACDRIIWTVKLWWVKFWRVQIDANVFHCQRFAYGIYIDIHMYIHSYSVAKCFMHFR